MHPILKNKRSLFYFILAWILVTVIHVIVLSIINRTEFRYAILDGMVFNSVMAIIALGLWYPVRFIRSDESSHFALIVNHLGIGFLSITLWITLSYFAIETVIRQDDLYMDFLDQSLPWRGVTGILFYLVILLIYYLVLYYSDLQEKVRLEADLKTLVKESELNMLKSQINPHFLFNSLNSINSLILADQQKAQDMIIKLSEFLRYALKHHQKEKTHLQDELHNINLYLDIERIRFGEKLVIQNKIDEQFGICYLPNMILQPLIENAIKHGVYESTKAITITLDCFQSDDLLTIVITNNFDPDQPGRKGNGMGLKNIRNRLKLIYNRDDLFRYNRGDDIFEVSLSIPYEV